MPYAKGEGASQMVADLVSADYGWLHSPDGKDEAQVFFKAGKNHKGYFTNDDVLDQAAKSMDILEKYYADKDHVLVFDNAMTHLKHADGLSPQHICQRGHQSLKPIGGWRLMPKTMKESQFTVQMVNC